MVMAITSLAHADGDGDASPEQALTVVTTSILTAPVAVMDQAIGWTPISQDLSDRLTHQGAFHGQIHGPADHHDETLSVQMCFAGCSQNRSKITLNRLA
jgi:hypothetical protein